MLKASGCVHYRFTTQNTFHCKIIVVKDWVKVFIEPFFYFCMGHIVISDVDALGVNGALLMGKTTMMPPVAAPERQDSQVISRCNAATRCRPLTSSESKKNRISVKPLTIEMTF